MERTSFKMEYSNITMVKGNTVSFNIEVMDGNGDPMMMDSASFACKKDPAGLITIFEKTLGNGIVQDEDGLITVRIAPEDTAETDAGRYYYEFRLGTGDDVFTILIGIFDIEQNVAE